MRVFNLPIDWVGMPVWHRRYHPTMAKKPLTSAQRQRRFKEEQERAGLVQVAVWIPAEAKDRHAAYVKRLVKESKK